MPGTMADVVACPACSRNNGAHRTTCLYCGAALPVTVETMSQQVPTLRPVEDWERGFSVILAPLDREAPTDRQFSRFCEITRIEQETARAVFEARTSLPVARVPTLAEAEVVARLLGDAELGATVIADSDLDLKRVPPRLREIRLGAELLEGHVLWGEWMTIARNDILLVVEGRIVGTQIEIVESPGRKRGNMDLFDTSQFFVESYAIDVYTASLEQSVRIKPDSFDFGCLGARPSPRLEENIVSLRELLMQYVGASRYDTSYGDVARLLEAAWPAASQVQSHGLARRGDFRKYLRSSVTTDAALQFTKYSRMKFLLATSNDARV